MRRPHRLPHPGKGPTPALWCWVGGPWHSKLIAAPPPCGVVVGMVVSSANDGG